MEEQICVTLTPSVIRLVFLHSSKRRAASDPAPHPGDCGNSIQTLSLSGRQAELQQQAELQI